MLFTIEDIEYGKWHNGDKWDSEEYSKIPLPGCTIVLLIGSDSRHPSRQDYPIAARWDAWEVKDAEGYIYDLTRAGYQHTVQVRKCGQKDEFVKVTHFAILPDS